MVSSHFARGLCVLLAIASATFTIGCATDAPQKQATSLGDPEYPGIAMGRARAAVSRAKIDDAEKAARLQKLVGAYNLKQYENHQERDAKIAAIRAESDAALSVDRDCLIAALR